MRQSKKHIATAKIEAFTLFESVIAITIITVLVGLGTMIYSNLIHAEKPIAYYQAKDEIDLHFNEMQNNPLFFNKDFEYENFRIEQRVELHNSSRTKKSVNKKLYQITYTAVAGDKEILTERHLVANTE